MTEDTTYEHGMTSWADLATPDPEGTKAFYTDLFGWEVQEMPAGEGRTYLMFLKDGMPMAAAYETYGAQRASGAPPTWNGYVTVANVEEATARVKEAGGKVLAPPFDVMDAGRMATVEDPSGAALSLWQAGTHAGAAVRGEPGSLSWFELLTHDPDAVKPFYAALFGWRAEEVQMPSGPYTIFWVGERAAGGMWRIQPEWGEMPSAWYVYFEVADADLAVKRAEELGGSVEVPLADVPTVGRFAMLHDAQGGHFWVIQSAPPEG